MSPGSPEPASDPLKASDIAVAVGGQLHGDGDPEILGVAPLESACDADLAFLAHRKYRRYVSQSRAGVILVGAQLDDTPFPGPRIVVPDVHQALATVLGMLYPEAPPARGVHRTADLGDGVRLGADASVGAYAVVGRDVRVGERASIGPHCVVGEGAVLAEDVTLHGHVTLYPGVEIGPRSIVHAGCRLGVDGFGYAQDEGGLRKIPQVGGCRIGADVEIGANTTIDRGSIGVTRIGNGVKIDNLVHIAHNVTIGDHSVVVAQVGIAGSTKVGRGVTLAGQAGIPGHLEIGDGATIAAQAGVFGDVPAGATYSGYPARPHKESLRLQAALGRVSDLLKRVRRLERDSTGGGE
ncbi:MAG: UDP-3-O-(3-hydroxymyristoyl)glucosamine N-acyltransferase [Gemmatimonadota bacterium]